MTPSELYNEVLKLRYGIRQHRDEKGHDRCWIDDEKLYLLLPEKQNANFVLPIKCEFLTNCEKFWEDRQPKQSKSYWTYFVLFISGFYVRKWFWEIRDKYF
jgi:hypothetical protein